MSNYARFYASPFGDLLLISDGSQLIELKFVSRLLEDQGQGGRKSTRDERSLISDSNWLKRNPVQALKAITGDSGLRHELSPFETVVSDLDAYFDGNLRQFNCSFNFKVNGTSFQHSVWNALCEIPYGTTVTYSELANSIGNPKAQRAVGLANNRNPLAIFVPCHRVIGANGSLVGYAGGLPFKKALLHLEHADTELNLNAKSSRDIIAQVAAEEFAAFGFNGSRVDRIATKSGINKRMIYEYFGDKEGLYTYVSQHLTQLNLSDVIESQLKLWDIALNRDHSDDPVVQIAQLKQGIEDAQKQGTIHHHVKADDLAKLVYLVEQYAATIPESDTASASTKEQLYALLRSLISVPTQLEPVVSRVQ